jgi:hypothetical protein
MANCIDKNLSPELIDEYNEKYKKQFRTIDYSKEELKENALTILRVMSLNLEQERQDLLQEIDDALGAKPNTVGLSVLKIGKELNKKNNYTLENSAEITEYTAKRAKGTLNTVITNYQRMNRAAAFIKQNRKALLVKFSDVLSRFTDKENKTPIDISEILYDGATEQEQNAINTFFTVASEWKERITNNFKDKSINNSLDDIRFDYKNGVKDFLDSEKNPLDENLVTGIAHGAYTWLLESATKSAIKDNESILGINGFDDDGSYHITRDGFNALKFITGTENTVVNEIGQKIIESLGITVENAPSNYLPSLKAAFGAYGLRILEQDNLITKTEISNSDLNKYITKEDNDKLFTQIQTIDENDISVDQNGEPDYEVVKQARKAELHAANQKRTFVQISRKPDLSLNERTAFIVDSTKNSSGALSKAFLGEADVKEISLIPLEHKQKYQKRTKQGIAKVLKESMTKTSKVGKKAIPTMVKSMKILGDEAFLIAAGFNPDIENTVHINKRSGAEAKNNSLQTQIDYINSTLNSNSITQRYYALREAWSNSRVGIAASNLNEQSSKLVRHIFTNDAWEASIDMTDPESVELYKVVIAQNLGIKVDQQSNEDSVKELLNTLADPDLPLGKLILELKKSLKDPDYKISEENKIAIGKWAGDSEGMSSLQAMISYAEYLNFDGSKGNVFKTTVLAGVDGKANGPMLTILSLGAGNTISELNNVVQRGGFYSVQDGKKNFSEFHQTGEPDIYGVLTNSVLEAFENPNTVIDGKKRDTQITFEEYNSLQTILGDFRKSNDNKSISSAGRKFGKLISTAFNFGSSIRSSRKGAARDVLGFVYDRIAESHIGYVNKDINAVDIDAVITAINTLAPKLNIQNSDGTLEGKASRAKELFDTVFDNNQEQLFKESLDSIIGNAIEAALKTNFATLIERRDALNSAVQKAQGIFSVAYNTLRKAEIDRLMAEGKLAYFTDKNDNKTPLRDLTQEEEAVLLDKLIDIAPLTHTLYSQEEGDITTGKLMVKHAIENGSESFHEYQVKMFDPVQQKDITVNGNARISAEKNIGVGGVAALIHSLDSWIMHKVLGENYNGHDEIAGSVNDVVQNAKNINESVWNALLQYSPLDAAYNTMEKTVTNVIPLIESGQLSKEDAQKLKEVFLNNRTKPNDRKIVEKNPSLLVVHFLQQAYQQAYDAKAFKLEALANMGSIDQYTFNNGQYEPTDANRAEAQKLLDEHLATSRALPQATIKAAMELTNYINNTKEVKENKLDQITEENVIEEITLTDTVETDTTLSNEFGMFNLYPKPSKENNEIANLLTNETTDGKDFIPKLIDYINNSTTVKNKGFKVLLLKAIAKGISPDLKISIITKETDPSFPMDIPESKTGGVNAWYSKSSNTKIPDHIYVLSTDFVKNGLTTDILIHELVHAASLTALKQAIRSTSGAHEAHIELTKLLQQARKYIKDNKDSLDPKKLFSYEYGVTNLDEFLAVGLTEVDFQNDILSNLVDEEETTGLLNGLQKFVNNLINLLFNDTKTSKNKIVNSGMTSLIRNAAFVFNQSAEDVKKGIINKESATVSVAMDSPTQKYTTHDIYNAIQDPAKPLSPSFDTKLLNLLDSIVDKLHGPYGSLRNEALLEQAGSPLQVWLEAQREEKVPFASAILGSGFNVSDQEAFVMDQIEVTINEALNNDTTAVGLYRELSKLYKEASTRLEVKDFHPGTWTEATPQEIKQAEALYNFVFEPKKLNDGKSRHLARFAALTLANKQFNAMMQIDSNVSTAATGKQSIANFVQKVFEKILEIFQKKMNVQGKTIDEQVQSLISNLISIEAQKRVSKDNFLTNNKVLNDVNEKAAELTDEVKKLISDLANTNVLVNNKNLYVRTTAKVVSVIANDQVNQAFDIIQQIRDKVSEDQLGIVAGIFNDIRGPNQSFEALLVASKKAEAGRVRITGAMNKVLNSAFENNGENLTQEDKTALTKTFLDTGAHVLLDTMNIEELSNILSDPSKLAQATQKLEVQIKNLAPGAVGARYIEQANLTGYWAVTGINYSPILLKNSHNISRLIGYKEANDTKDIADKAEPLINKLIALNALAYTSEVYAPTAIKILKAENARGVDTTNGVENMLLTHKRLEKESREKLFDNNPTLMEHGYTPDITNPYKDVKAATQAEGNELVKLGYVLVNDGMLLPDPDDSNKEPKYLYVLHDGAQTRRVSGAVSLNTTGARGTGLFEGTRDPSTATGRINAKLLSDFTRARKNKIGNPVSKKEDLSKRTKSPSLRAPLLDENGNITNWQAQMNAYTKDSILNRNSLFDAVLSTYTGSVYDKKTISERNDKVILEAKKQFDEDYYKRPESYVLIGPKSKTKENLDLWNMLPNETKQTIQNTFSAEGMYVKKVSKDLVFGFSKRSLANLFNEDVQKQEDLNKIEKILAESFVLFMHKLFGDDAKVKVARTERIWMELVSEMKDIIVVKTGMVTIGNWIANQYLLKMQGVSMKDMAHHQLVAMRGASAYSEDKHQLDLISLNLENGFYTNPNEKRKMEREVLRLEDSIAKNPVTKLMDEGLMPAIVEDLQGEEGEFSYKSDLNRKVERVKNKINPKLLKAGEYAYIAHNTAAYQALNRGAQLSDFVARYTLYQHNITKKNPMTHKEAVQDVRDAFINYDVPMQRSLQYLDDAALIIFTKYFLRIQRVLVQSMKERPLNWITLGILDHYLSLSWDITESIGWTRLGNNPFTTGPVGLIDAIPEIATFGALDTITPDIN